MLGQCVHRIPSCALEILFVISLSSFSSPLFLLSLLQNQHIHIDLFLAQNRGNIFFLDSVPRLRNQ